MTSARIKTAAARLRDWVIQDALPLWLDAGFDLKNDRFEERLTLKGERLPSVPIRLMVQARQVYVYGLAARRGWHSQALDRIERAFPAMVRDFHRRDGGHGWVFSIRRDGSVVDQRRDLYAHAFALLGVASYVKATADRRALSVADETLAYIDQHMQDPAGGYVDALPARDSWRRQNPHMHLLEGLLSLWSASGDRRYLSRAEKIVELFRMKFFKADKGVLLEYFDARLEPAPGVTGQIVEPGHHYEWAWLLDWFGRESGWDASAYARALYAHAARYGYDAGGLIVDELLADGSVHTPSHRLWPITEAIKANIVEMRNGSLDAPSRLVALAGALHERFFTRFPAGGWIDRFDAEGRAAADFMPASSLYHIVCAIDELVGAVN